MNWNKWREWKASAPWISGATGGFWQSIPAHPTCNTQKSGRAQREGSTLCDVTWCFCERVSSWCQSTVSLQCIAILVCASDDLPTLFVNNFVTRASLQGCPYKSARVSEAALRFLLPHVFLVCQRSGFRILSNFAIQIRARNAWSINFTVKLHKMGHHVNSIPILSHNTADSAAVSSAKQRWKNSWNG